MDTTKSEQLLDILESLQRGDVDVEIAAGAIVSTFNNANASEKDSASEVRLKRIVSGAEWIRVEDKLPHEFKTVLFWVPEYENIVTGYLDGRSGNLIKHSDTVIGEVTHWAKLPEPPKEYH